MRIQPILSQEIGQESSLQIIRKGIALTTVVLAITILHPGKTFPQKPAQAIPPEYQDKQMPNGWLTDPQVLAAGKSIYEGKTNSKVKCIGCHGEDGQPTRKGRGAPDFSDPSEAQVSDAQWFWKISEGKRRTKMRGQKKQLTEKQRWQIIAYMRTFAKSSQ